MLVFQRMNEADGVYEGNGALRLLGIPYASCRNVAVLAALAMKILSFRLSVNVYAVSTVFENAIWFVLGMYACCIDISRMLEKAYAAILGLFCIAAFCVCCSAIGRPWTACERFVNGLIACVGVVALAGHIYRRDLCAGCIRFLSKYTMPVFLMHTLFAAAWRSVLLALGIDLPGVHIVSGVVVSFAGPIVAAEIMTRIRWLDFIMYPQKYILNKK